MSVHKDAFVSASGMHVWKAESGDVYFGRPIDGDGGVQVYGTLTQLEWAQAYGQIMSAPPAQAFRTDGG